MSVDLLTRFIEETSHDTASVWDYPSLIKIAGGAPSELLGDQEPLLRGDQHRLWLRWYVEGLISPQRVANAPVAIGRLEVFADVVKRVEALHPGIDRKRLEQLADGVTNHLWAEIERLRKGSKREGASKATKLALMQSTAVPRCYICGYEFTQEAREAFLGVQGAEPVKLPDLVDVLQPRGLTARDISIEVEHIVPVAAGGRGQDNLKLACGWCNKYKSSRISLYEATFLAPRVLGYSIGVHRLYELPHPFWTIRVLATRKRCSHAGGCDHTADTAQLHIGLTDWKGSPNPTNLAIFCTEHDSVRADRLQNAEDVKVLWEHRKTR